MTHVDKIGVKVAQSVHAGNYRVNEISVLPRIFGDKDDIFKKKENAADVEQLKAFSVRPLNEKSTSGWLPSSAILYFFLIPPIFFRTIDLYQR